MMSSLSKLTDRARSRLGDMWWYALLLFLIHRIGDFVNFYIGIWLVPRYVTPEELGAVNPVMSVASFVVFPLAIVLLPVGKFLSVFAAKKEYGKVRALLEDAIAISSLFMIAISFWLFFKGDAIMERLHITDRRILIPIAGFAFLTCIEPIVQTAQRALLCFKSILWAGIGSPYVRLNSMLLLLLPFGALGYLTSQMLTSFFSLAVGVFALILFFRRLGKRVNYYDSLKEMAVYAMPLLILTLASRVQAPVESFVIRHRLPLDVSAGYYYVTLFGSIPGYITNALVVFLWPIVSNRFEKGEDTGKLLVQSMFFTFLLGGIVLAIISLIIPYVFSLKGPWQGYEGYSVYVWQFGFITILKSLQSVYAAHQSAVRRFNYVWYLSVLYLAEAFVLYVLPAWSLFKSYLPSSVWNFVNNNWVLSLQSFLSIIMLFNFLFVVAMLIDWRMMRRCGAERR